MSAIVKISLIFVISLVILWLVKTFTPIPFPDVAGDVIWRATHDIGLQVPAGSALVVTAVITFYLWAVGKL